MDPLEAAPPALDVAAAAALERTILAGDEAREWSAMRAAGRGVAAAIRQDLGEIDDAAPFGTALVLAGKGHNAGDALLAAADLAAAGTVDRIEVLLCLGSHGLRPLTRRALATLETTATATGTSLSCESLRPSTDVAGLLARVPGRVLLLDGIFGVSFRPPVDDAVGAVLAAVNAWDRRGWRAAVDLPTGLSHPGSHGSGGSVFRADATYATGILKTALLAPESRHWTGRLRFIDLGFFQAGSPLPAPSHDRLLTADLLAMLTAPRSAASDKRSYGHVALLGGSRTTPGALLLAVRSALHSGAGLVTAFAPESVHAAFAAAAPEAMWVPWPESPGGGLALEGRHLFLERASRFDAAVIGPGIGREREPLDLAASIARDFAGPLVLDADALQPALWDLLVHRPSGGVATPHAGEWARMCDAPDAPTADARFRDWARTSPPRVALALKGPVTRLAARQRICHLVGGNPVLARAGSGDVLAGLIGGRLAAEPGDPPLAAAVALAWQAAAADHLARSRGTTSVVAGDLVTHLGSALRSSCPPAP